MTNQEAFDTMVKHLRSLPRPSRDRGNGACCYNGAKCAVGALFTEEEQARYGDYSGGVYDLLSRMSADGHSSAMHRLNGYFLYEMQDVHDSLCNWAPDGFDGESILVNIAREFGLIYTPPN